MGILGWSVLNVSMYVPGPPPSPISHALWTDIYTLYYLKLSYVTFLVSNVHSILLNNVPLVRISSIYYLPNVYYLQFTTCVVPVNNSTLKSNGVYVPLEQGSPLRPLHYMFTD